MNQFGVWLSILDYASAKKISISTIRRAIKSGQLSHKEENGKYFIWCEERFESATSNNQTELETLRQENRKLKEEIEDLKMLLSVYETKNNETFTLPPLPEIEL